MLTLTKEEVECMGCETLDKYRRTVHDYFSLAKLGVDSKWDVADELRLAIYALGYWEQEKFTYLNNINYLNDYDIRSIYKRIRDL